MNILLATVHRITAALGPRNPIDQRTRRHTLFSVDLSPRV